MKQFIMRLTEEDHKVLVESAKIMRMSMSAFARNVVMTEAINVVKSQGGEK